jgi:hypothetical protein
MQRDDVMNKRLGVSIFTTVTIGQWLIGIAMGCSAVQ